MTDALQRPRPETGADTVRILVCASCRAVGGEPDSARPGAILAAALGAALAEGDNTDIAVETVECLSVCKRPCTVAVASPGRWTYVYGDLDPASAAETILDGLSRYAATPDGLVPWRERPDAFRKGVVARIPPAPVRSA